MHIDFEYQTGAPNVCEFPICCRAWPASKAQSGSAGYWGDYLCDLPSRTLKTMFEFINKNQDTLKTDFITWTGDNSAHNVWDNTNEEITNYT